MNAKMELVQNWLIKAQHDLAAARKLAAGPDPYLDVAVYHCQQAAEKAVKGFLVFHDQPFERTRDVEVLVALAVPFEAGFPEWTEAAALLTPYATEFRYQSSLLEPSRDEFSQVLEAASGLYAFVLSLLPSDLHPS
ncbi:MAG: HEPN domain-containing protein [Anaerolineae bacterium]|jgi:HEPN domain-containing protein